jgi:hypothetical protein
MVHVVYHGTTVELSNPRVRATCAPCMEKIYEKLRKPARSRHAKRSRNASIYTRDGGFVELPAVRVDGARGDTSGAPGF